MPDDDVQLVLYRGASSDWLAVTDYLALDAAAAADVRADLRHVTMSITVDGVEQLAHKTSLGPLACIVAQLPQAAERLSANSPALLRSGVLDIPEGHYLLFEPHDGDRVRLSFLMIDELPMTSTFPHDPEGGELYAWVAAHCDELVAASRELGRPPIELTIDRMRLAAAFEREARAGAALLSRPTES